MDNMMDNHMIKSESTNLFSPIAIVNATNPLRTITNWPHCCDYYKEKQFLPHRHLAVSPRAKSKNKTSRKKQKKKSN